MQTHVNLVDLVKSFPCPFFSIFFSNQIHVAIQTSIHLQNSASIQPRTSLSKFANNYLVLVAKFKVRIKLRKNIGHSILARRHDARARVVPRASDESP